MDNLMNRLETAQQRGADDEEIELGMIEERTRKQNSIGICRNLTALCDAFADLNSCDILTLPASEREAAREAVYEAWQILDLINDLEAESANFGSPRAKSPFNEIASTSWTMQ